MVKLISQGGFGCVFYPSIQCDKKSPSNKKMVSKIQKNNAFSKKEIDIGELIMKIHFYTYKIRYRLQMIHFLSMKH